MLSSDKRFQKERRKTKSFFNLISIIYPIIEGQLYPEYRKYLNKLNLPAHLSVLDLATGTGILAAAFANRGHRVTAFDFSERLLKRASKRFPDIAFKNFDLIHLSDLPDNKFDIISMGYFLHGVSPDFRRYVLRQAARITNKYVLIFDYGKGRNWLVNIIEWIEGPHYFNYIKQNRKNELAGAGLKIIGEIKTTDFGQLWLCIKNGD